MDYQETKIDYELTYSVGLRQWHSLHAPLRYAP